MKDNFQEELATIAVEKKDSYALITIDRPEALNVINTQVIMELKKVLLELKDEKELRSLIITGRGEKAFAAGADVGEMKDMSPSEARDFSRDGQQLMQQIEEFPRPIIAAVNGYTLGGGHELMLACDLVIAGEEAVFGQPETGLGIMPGYGATQRLPRQIGERRAKYLLYTGARIEADEALDYGLVNEVVESDSVLSRAEELAETIGEQAPVALKLTKESINFGLNEGIDKGTSHEINAFSLCFNTKDQEIGLKAFLEKEEPEFEGR